MSVSMAAAMLSLSPNYLSPGESSQAEEKKDEQAQAVHQQSEKVAANKFFAPPKNVASLEDGSVITLTAEVSTKSGDKYQHAFSISRNNLSSPEVRADVLGLLALLSQVVTHDANNSQQDGDTAADTRRTGMLDAAIRTLETGNAAAPDSESESVAPGSSVASVGSAASKPIDARSASPASATAADSTVDAGSSVTSRSVGSAASKPIDAPPATTNSTAPPAASVVTPDKNDAPSASVVAPDKRDASSDDDKDPARRGSIFSTEVGLTTCSPTLDRGTSAGSQGVSSTPLGPHIQGFGPAILTPNTENIDRKYFIDYTPASILGEGLNTIVRKCKDRETGEYRAVKSVKRSDESGYKQMLREANFLSDIDHPTIVKNYDTYEDEEYLHMVIDLCQGGDLYDYIAACRKTGVYHPPERQVAQIVLQLLRATSYLHERDIAYRDHKLENVLLRRSNQKSLQGGGGAGGGVSTEVCLIDFDLSVREQRNSENGELIPLKDCVGTNYYFPPEVLNKSYTHTCDLWSLGVVVYCLLGGKPPFLGKDDDEIQAKINAYNDDIEFPAPAWSDISGEAKNFVRCLLRKDPNKRPSAAEMIKHAWVVKHTKKPELKKQGSSFARIFTKKKKEPTRLFQRSLVVGGGA